MIRYKISPILFKMLTRLCLAVRHAEQDGFSVLSQFVIIIAHFVNFASTTHRYTQDNNVHIWARGPAKPPCRLFNIYTDMYKYQVLSINERTEAPKPDTKTPKNQQVEKTRGTCTPDQGSGATLGVLGYASA